MGPKDGGEEEEKVLLNIGILFSVCMLICRDVLKIVWDIRIEVSLFEDIRGEL